MKRFSGREFAMLAAPILGIGAVAWWMSSRPSVPGKRLGQLTFHIAKPTTLEAFRGANVAFVVGSYYLAEHRKHADEKTSTRHTESQPASPSRAQPTASQAIEQHR